MRTPFPRLLSGLLVLLTFVMLGPPASAVVDDLRVRQLENEVLRLQRELDAQSRRIEELERTTRTASIGRSTSVAPSRAADSSPAWLVPTNWDRLKPGMKALEVIAVLGRPTSVRTEESGKIHSLLYALELGPDAVLAGNVRMGDSGVAEINKPILR